MELQELADILSRWYRNAPNGRKIAMVHLFGIVYANEIGKSSNKVVLLSELRGHPYGDLVRNGVHLAEYVTVKPGAKPF